MPPRFKLSYAPALLALAVAQASFAAATSTTDLTSTVVLSAPLGTESGSGNGIVYNSFLNFGYSIASGAFFINADNGTNGASGYQGLYYSATGATPTLVTPSTDTLHEYVDGSGLPIPYVQTNNPFLINGNGTALGKEIRGYDTNATNPSFIGLGSDSFVIVGPGTTANPSYTPTVITIGAGGTQTAFAADTNGYNGTTVVASATGGNGVYSNITLGNIYYSFPVGSNLSSTVNVVGLSSSNLVIGTAPRTDGVDNPANGTVLGTDAYIYDPNGHVQGQPDNGVTILPGVASDAYVITTHQSSTGTTLYYTNQTNTPVAVNAAGAVVGTSARNTPYASGSEITSGQDVWLYTPATTTSLGVPVAATSSQIGIAVAGVRGPAIASAIGGYFSVPITINSAATTPGTYNYQSSTVVGVSGTGSVAGASTVYSNASVTSTTGTATTPTSIGQEAWIYTPVAASGANTVGTGFTPQVANTPPVGGTYTQVGLITAGATPTTIGYVGSTGVGGTFNHLSTITAFSTVGNAAGLSTRYFTTSTTALGSDAWYYSPTGGTVPITPAASTAFSTYLSSGNSSTSGSLVINNAASAVVAGTQNRFAPASTTAEGTDGFAYVAADNTTYVIASPATLAGLTAFSGDSSYFNATEDFSTTIKGVTDSGIVYGYFTAYAGSTTGTPIGTYIFEWSELTGTELLAGTSSVATAVTIDTLSSSQWATLGMSLYADNNGNIFDIAKETGGLYGAIEISVPEPASLSLIGLGGLVLLRRRSRA